MKKSEYFDVHTTVERISAGNLLGNLTSAPDPESCPIVRYAQVLKELRKQSSNIGNEYQQLEFGRLLKKSLDELAEELRLPEGHFSVDTSGDPLLVREGAGQHWILPTHFEGGAYFSAPHADHQYSLRPTQIPRINIGRYVRFGKGSGINAGGDITIGDGAWLSPGSLLLRQDHSAYGRPSIGARTVSMTHQPGIVLRDYAWVGRDAMVGWNSDYLGLGSVVGTRSFVNAWVGDYSIVGDHGRILQYQPFKAFLFGRYELTVEEMLRISDWGKVDQDWRCTYADESAALLNTDMDLSELAELIAELTHPRSRALLIRPSSLRLVPLLARSRLDIATHRADLTPYVLQWASDHNALRVRVRSDLTGPALPFETAGTFHYNKRVGYDLIVCEHAPGTPVVPLAELERTLLRGGVLLADLRTLADAGDVPDNLVETRDLVPDGIAYKVFQKK
ncbi:acyltransferase [Streptomyces sp. NPDC018057]|uniref:acyltransferase n=1 Tax=unclassified Streptomyces TaxID=2593676 RepID=UPI0037A0FB34